METPYQNQPPVIDHPLVAKPPSRAGRIGLWLSLVAPAVIVLMVVLKPG